MRDFDNPDGQPVENAVSTLSGTSYGSAGSPLYARSTRVTLNDTNNNNVLPLDGTTGREPITYRLGDQQITSLPDSLTVISNCTIVQRLPSGEPQTTSGVTLRIMQDNTGNVFLLPALNDTGTEAALNDYPVISISLSSNSASYDTTSTGISSVRSTLTAFQDGYVDGTDGDDTINASYAGDTDGDRVDGSDAILPGAAPNDDFIRAGLGNDLVWAGAGADSVRGNDGNDTLYGYTSATVDDGANDSLDGGTGNDQLFGGGGDDLLIGGTGLDRLNGGTGADTIYGDDTLGTDTLGGADSIDAGIGNDSVVAGFGNDTVIGGLGADTIQGGAGDDRIFGDDAAGTDTQGGADLIDAGIGNDSVVAGAGNDTVTGGLGADTVQGGAGADVIYGDDATGTDTQGGADLIDAGTGNDSVIGGAGNDTVTGGLGADTILGGAGVDVIYGDDAAGTDTQGGADLIDAGTDNDSVVAGAGNDTVTGGLGADTVQGGAGADVIYGDDSLGTDTQGGADLLSGGEGNDTILGGFGNDTLQGDAGDDSLVGGEGSDSLLGGLGADTLVGGNGDDFLNGGEGNDLLFGGAGRDTFVAGAGDSIEDFNTGSDLLNRDFVDLSTYYNAANLTLWNQANPSQQFNNPLAWLRADQADGRLTMLGGQNGLPTLDLAIRNSGTAVAGVALDATNTGVLCFGADALIETEAGPVPAGELSVGDLVCTRDAGLQPLRWVGRRVLTRAEFEVAPHLRPIRIRAGALGAGTPSADLIVSPQHRVLVRSKIAQKMFGSNEVLVAAKQLLLVDGIDIAQDLEGVTYVHFLFDDHQVVWSNGAETESLHPGRTALDMAGEAAREEILALFPELRNGSLTRPSVRVLASGRMGRKLAMRHAQNRRPLVA
ncbi:Hint domain-containing protein [Paracoccus chinensis]|nr:Hint domain-containing protein [Paracoccus chinensis]